MNGNSYTFEKIMFSSWYLSIFLTLVEYSSSIRVCDTFYDYLSLTNAHCRNNPDAESNVTEILRRWGCTVEEYYITTDDGYEILIVEAFMNISKSTPIIMAHGIMTNSLTFVGKYNKTAAYHLAVSGYRMFLVNFRGSLYSTRHVNMTADDRSYWNFSFHEMGVYDLRSAVDFVFNITNQKAIVIAFSMGTTQSMVYASTYPNEATNRLKGLILLAPIATFVSASTPMKLIAPFWAGVRPFFEALWNGMFFPPIEAIDRFCSSGPGAFFICDIGKSLVLGEDLAQMDPLYLPVTNRLYNDRTGINVVGHFAQIMTTGRFTQYDYGMLQNIEIYGSLIPPSYEISNINVPTALFVGLNDWLASPGDAVAISARLGSSLCGLTFITNPRWNHMDFLTAKDMNLYLNVHVIDKISEMEEERCPRDNQ